MQKAAVRSIGPGLRRDSALMIASQETCLNGKVLNEGKVHDAFFACVDFFLA